jgi:GTPase SAR1 family protein
LLTYDITREETFVDAGEWLKEVKQYSHPDIKIFLIGNQADKEQS